MLTVPVRVSCTLVLLSVMMFPTAVLLGEYMVLPTVVGRRLAVSRSPVAFSITRSIT